MRGSARHLTLAAVIGPRGLRWSLLCLLAVVGLPVVAAADAQAGFEFLAVRWDLPPYGDKLYRLSVEHSASGGYYFTSEEEIGPLGYPISGTAQGRSGTLYALDPWDRILLRVDRSTGAASPLVTLDIYPDSGASDIAIDSSGRMWLGSGTSLYRVDMATGATTLVGDTGVELGSLAALNGKLYITGTGEFMSGGEVFKIDSDTAQAHSVYTYPPQWPPLLGELASDGHLLWIAEWWVGEPGPPGDYKLRAFDPSTGDWPFEIYWCTVTEPIFLDALEVVAFRQSPAIPAISGPGLLILVGSLALGGVALLRARAALG